MVGMNFIFHAAAVMAFSYLIWELARHRSLRTLNGEINRRHLRSESCIKVVSGSFIKSWVEATFSGGLVFKDRSSSITLFKVDLKELFLLLLLMRVREVVLSDEKILICAVDPSRFKNLSISTHTGSIVKVEVQEC